VAFGNAIFLRRPVCVTWAFSGLFAHAFIRIPIMTCDTLYPTNCEIDLGETVRDAQQGDREAFGLLVERYQDSVYHIAYRRLRNHAEAQELCQDVFVQAMRKIDQLQDPECFGAWVRSIAGRMAINRAMRRHPMGSPDIECLDASYAEQETPLMVMLGRERNDQVRQGLRRLGSLDRKTLTAFYFDGHSLIEMSEQFASPVGTIKRRLHVARKRLAKELEGMTVG
jgi:RNA polymerase sigma-70 factor (ECF subfamily)